MNKSVQSLFFAVLLLGFIAGLSSCDALKKAISETQAFMKCQFRASNVNNIRLAGIDVQRVRSINDLSLAQVTSAGLAFANKNMPLSLNLNVDVRNPNASAAAMAGMDWIILIDGVDMVQGAVSNPVNIAANGGTATIPLAMSVNVFQLLSGKSRDAIINFASGIAGASNEPAKLSVKVRPSFRVGTQIYKMPNYLEVKGNFKSLR